jgi:hypothetical protein
MQRRLRLLALAPIFALLFFLSAGACETYDSPPRVELVGLVDGVLPDPLKPIELVFSEPINPDSLKIKIIRVETDVEGNLPDEQKPKKDLVPLFTWEKKTDAIGGLAVLSEDRRKMTITLFQTLPTGPSLAVLIEPGLADVDGNDWEVRQRLVFAFKFSCENATPTTIFKSGAYFLIADVEKPLATQIQLLGIFEVDETTGFYRAQLTNADRNRDVNRCSPACMAGEACRTIPAQACEIPSTKAGSEDEFPDFLPNFTPPTGYSVTALGCLSEKDGIVTFANQPVDVVIEEPPVTVQAIELSASFVVDGEGVLRGTGSVTASQVLIGGNPSGTASGSMIARLIPADQVPPGIPGVPKE